MRRCLDLASNGAKSASPNPMVGAVIVKDQAVIAEAFHHSPGHPHAEALAIDRLDEEMDLRDATLYVNLEPCCHHGRTPPCAERILEAGIGKLVFGAYDPSEKVAGKGLESLKENGCEVEGPVLEHECREFNRRFFTSIKKERPYLILKWAQTLDGYIDRERTNDEKGINWITGKVAQETVHQWRAEEDAILVGKETVRKDDPSLTVRLMDGPDPLRILIDRKGQLPRDRKLFREAPPALIFTEMEEVTYPSHMEQIQVSTDPLQCILKELHSREIRSLMVEGGSKVINSFIRRGLWDEARVLVGNRWFGTGKAAPRLGQEPHAQYELGVDRLLLFKKSDA